MIDSTSTIPKEYKDKYNIAILEILVELDGEYKKELTEIDTDNFTNNFHNLEKVPATSFASPSNALTIFNDAINDGYSHLLYPYMTTQISNQVNSARLAGKKINDKVKICFYPTQYAGPSQAPFLLYSLKMIEQGKNIQEIIDFFDKVKQHFYTIGFSKDFSTLFRSGKVKKNAQMSIITSLLKLKPICEIPLDQGVIGFGGGIGIKGSLKKIVSQIKKKTDSEIIYDAIITHSNDEKSADLLIKEAKKIRKIKDIKIWKIPPAIVCSVGKGAAMITLYPNFEAFENKIKGSQ